MNFWYLFLPPIEQKYKPWETSVSYTILCWAIFTRLSMVFRQRKQTLFDCSKFTNIELDVQCWKRHSKLKLNPALFNNTNKLFNNSLKKNTNFARMLTSKTPQQNWNKCFGTPAGFGSGKESRVLQILYSPHVQIEACSECSSFSSESQRDHFLS